MLALNCGSVKDTVLLQTARAIVFKANDCQKRIKAKIYLIVLANALILQNK